MPLQKTPPTPEHALRKLESLCARSETSSGEAIEKLRRTGITGSAARAIVEKLKATRFIDDRRFAGAFARDKSALAHWGARRIAMALRAKGITQEIAAEAIGEIDPEVFAASLRRLLEAKLRASPSLTASPQGRAKLYAAALRAGFLSQEIFRAMRSLRQNGQNG